VYSINHLLLAEHQWLTPIILATQEAEIGSIEVPSQPQHSLRDPIPKKTHYKKGLVEWLKLQALSSSPIWQKKIISL
jgi:hypothetical protein